MASPAPPPRVVENALALAVIALSEAPLLLLDGDLVVIATSASFCSAFQIDPDRAAGLRFTELGAGEWKKPQLGVLLRATADGHAAIDAYEMELERKGFDTRHIVVNASRLVYENDDEVRLLVAITDVTDARASEKIKDDLLREKGILLQEIQHRVANSLQIVASVLMQSARRVQSEETRSHLQDAHQRVMSVATLQKQLARSQLSEVRMHTYLTDLCASISASMIRDHNQLSLEVTGDNSVAAADSSVSLGLIVTELVINSLKHAFPGHRPGKIVVDYRSQGPNWTLTVRDNGVGMPEDAANTAHGLGTSLVEALCRQLNARVKVTGADPGTTVSVTHTRIAAVGGEATAAITGRR